MTDARQSFSFNAAKIDAACIGMVLYTEKTPNGSAWDRRGVVDSYYIDPRAKLVSIGVDQRDIIDVATDREVMFMPVPA